MEENKEFEAIEIKKEEIVETKDATSKQINAKKVFQPIVAFFLGVLTIEGVRRIDDNMKDNVTVEKEIVTELPSEEKSIEESDNKQNFAEIANEDEIEENSMKTEEYNIPTANELNDSLRNNYFYGIDEIYTYKNNELNAFMLTATMCNLEDWQLIGTLDDDFCDKLININATREPDVLSIWQLEQKNEEGNWMPMTDIAYNELEPIVTDENERWVKIGQEYMATLQTTFYNMNVYKPENMDNSIIIADDIDAGKIFPKIKMENVNDLHLVPTTVIVHDDEVGRSK